MFRQLLKVFPEVGTIPRNSGHHVIRKSFATKPKSNKSQDSSKKDLTGGSVPVIGTHDGVFHCDEVLACFMLQQLPRYENATVLRTRDQKQLDACDIVVDVGGVYDAKKNRFDHSQASFNETFHSLRPEVSVKHDVRLSSAGLIYAHFGEEVIRQILKRRAIEKLPEGMIAGVYRKIYDVLIGELDGIDNGIPPCVGAPKYIINTHLTSRVGHFNPAWNEQVDADGMKKRFEQAKAYVGEAFVYRVIYYVTRWWPVREIVENAILSARQEVHESGQILELEMFCPWKEHLFELEGKHGIEGVPKFVIYHKKLDDWRVCCVPREPTSFVCRKFLVAKWRGEIDEKLAKLSGIEGTNFCHQTGFLGGCKTREGALKMAIRSLEAKE